MPVEPQAVQRALLAWYDAHARALPWRSPPGAARADPYRVWLSEIMLQQTTVAAVVPYFERFTRLWPDVAALAAATDADVMREWAGLGYYARARNLIAAARAVVARGGFPGDEAGLRALPGVGAYTAAAIASIAFGHAAVVVDGNIERVMARLFAVETPLPVARPALYAHAATLTPAHRPGDHAQALMDLGSRLCTPRNPDCAGCPLVPWCAAAVSGDPARFPVRLPKQARPVRYGTAFWLESAGAVLLVRRPASGLLGGMLALPTGPWGEDVDPFAGAPVSGDWQLLPGQVRHVFTHFELRLRVARLDHPMREPEGEWTPRNAVARAGLPTLFAKAAALAYLSSVTPSAASATRRSSGSIAG